MQEVILVDTSDRETGREEKLAAHDQGLLHRAFSVMIYDKKGNILIQQRASNKYHSSELWSNACCSHPAPGEKTIEAAKKRLIEEMGISANLHEVFEFRYKITFANGIIENEYDHVFSGTWEGTPNPDPAEVMAWKWVNPTILKADMEKNPGLYTYWFRLIMERI
jgi:isopentenyl-diphosphate Delta-isomerase